MLVGEQIDLAQVLAEPLHPVDAGALHRRVLERGQPDDAVKILAGERRAEGRGHGNPALAVDFVDEGVDEQRHRPYAFRPLRPARLLNYQQLQRLGGRLLGTLRPVMGYQRIIWASMVIDSKCLDFRDICCL